MPGGEAIRLGPDGTRHQVRLEDRAMIASQRRQVAEEHALPRQFFVERGPRRLPVHVGHSAGETRAVGQERREFR